MTEGIRKFNSYCLFIFDSRATRFSPIGIRLKIFISLFILLLSVSQFDLGLSRVLDPTSRSPERAILELIASDLDARGIDTVYGNSMDQPFQVGDIRVAPLAGFTPNKRDWGSYSRLTWASAFEKGVIGFIIAVPNRTSPINDAQTTCIKDISELGSDICEFVFKWLAASPDERVFISFTKEDFDHASQVKEALEKAGYTAFLFLKGQDQKPWADPGMVGEVFAQAKFRIVVDSANARGSAGVALEHECCAPLLRPSPPTTPLMLALKGNT
jgi:hypothetical protein